jgi:uncharacterized membrane-anchored protein
LTSGSTNILVAPDNSWWATFDFDPSGYVKDDEKIDADALLKQLKESDAQMKNVPKGLKTLYCWLGCTPLMITKPKHRFVLAVILRTLKVTFFTWWTLTLRLTL